MYVNGLSIEGQQVLGNLDQYNFSQGRGRPYRKDHTNLNSVFPQSQCGCGGRPCPVE